MVSDNVSSLHSSDIVKEKQGELKRMNEMIELMLNHRSIRKFEDKPLSKEQIEQIVRAAQAASTSSFVQAYSIIGISDPEKKRELAALAGNQTYVEHNGYFYVFCTDLNRHKIAADMAGKDLGESLDFMEKFMVAVIDAALAAQNAAIAAESMGLGICYIGGIRNEIGKVSDLLKLPDRVIPLFGMAVGYPAHESALKPRLPLEAVFHENEYEDKEEQLKEYDETISAYYNERTKGKRKDRWSEQITAMLTGKQREHMKDFVNAKGYAKK